jgi:hypothetical protein
MGEKKRRVDSLQIEKVQRIAGYFTGYQYALNAAIAVLSVAPAALLKNPVLTVGRTGKFRSLLSDRSLPEEQLQKFLKSNPFFLYPDAINVWTKYPLGENYETDFVFLVQSQQEREAELDEVFARK